MTTENNLDIIEKEKFILVGRLSAKEYFGEGLTQLFFGNPITKALFHNVIQPEGSKGKEIRKAGQYLSMPTLVAIEFAHIILSAAKQSEKELMDDLNEQDKVKVSNLLKDFQLDPSRHNLKDIKAPPATKVVSKKRKLTK